MGEELLGWPKETFTGKSDYDLWPRAQAEFFVEKDREALKSGKIIDIPEEEIQTRHQGVRILHTKKVPILDSAGHPLYLLGISEDITERSRMEKEQRFLADANVVLSASLDFDALRGNAASVAQSFAQLAQERAVAAYTALVAHGEKVVGTGVVEAADVVNADIEATEAPKAVEAAPAPKPRKRATKPAAKPAE